MPCYSPLTGYYARELTANGKRRLTFKRQLSLTGEPIRVPCNQCVGCRLEKSRQWAMRCMHEKRLHKDNCFLTLTYETKNLPPGGTLVKRDLKLFIMRLNVHVWREHGHGIRYYACGEYGDINKRPHYHVLVFGFDFPDKVIVGANRRGDKYYSSCVLSDMWGLGHTMLGDVSFDSAAYVARYVMKKITGAEARRHYEVMDGDGVVYDRIPEFTVQSRKPGIGSGYYDKFGSEVRAHDSVVVNGREVRPPRFYDSRFEKLDPAGLKAVKRKRKKLARLMASDNTVDRLRVREALAVRLLKMKERAL